MGFQQGFEGEGRGQCSGVPDLKAVGEEHNLNAGRTVIVAVRYGVYDGLGYDIGWYFIGNGDLNALCPGADSKVDLGKNEIHRLIHQFKEIALVDLIKGDRFLNLCPVEMGALHLRGIDEPLGLTTEEEDRRVGKLTFSQETQMGEHSFNIGFRLQRQTAGGSALLTPPFAKMPE